jgi:hypothetical protein
VQLTIRTTAAALAFAQRQARGGLEADECFARPAVAELTMPMATKRSWRLAAARTVPHYRFGHTGRLLCALAFNGKQQPASRGWWRSTTAFDRSLGRGQAGGRAIRHGPWLVRLSA